MTEDYLLSRDALYAASPAAVGAVFAPDPAVEDAPPTTLPLYFVPHDRIEHAPKWIDRSMDPGALNGPPDDGAWFFDLRLRVVSFRFLVLCMEATPLPDEPHARRVRALARSVLALGSHLMASEAAELGRIVLALAPRIGACHEGE